MVANIQIFKLMNYISSTQSIRNTFMTTKKLVSFFVCDLDSLGGEYKFE